MSAGFPPPRHFGFLFYLIVLVILLVLAGWSFDQAGQVEIGLLFIVYLVIFFFAVLPISFVVYRLYVIARANYRIEPNGLRLQWGLRIQDIPMHQIRWIHRAEELNYPIPLPALRTPGYVAGTRWLRQGVPIEFMATTTRGLVVISTEKKMYAISPDEPRKFLKHFAAASEQGAINPIQYRSIYPVTLLENVWANLPVKVLLLLGFLLSVSLLIFGSYTLSKSPGLVLLIPGAAGRERVVTSAQFILLPVLNAVYFVIDLLLGFFFFRKDEIRALSYLLWGSSIVSSIMSWVALILALYFQP